MVALYHIIKRLIRCHWFLLEYCVRTFGNHQTHFSRQMVLWYHIIFLCFLNIPWLCETYILESCHLQVSFFNLILDTQICSPPFPTAVWISLVVTKIMIILALCHNHLTWMELTSYAYCSFQIPIICLVYFCIFRKCTAVFSQQ